MSRQSTRLAAPIVMLASFTAACLSAGQATALAPVSEASQRQEHAFDFLIGTWAVQNTFLAKRLQHSREWLHFAATDIERPLPTGTGNIEVYKTRFWPRFIGMSVRLYNPATHEWTIYWTDNRYSRGVLQPPVVGSFRRGYGVFEGNDHFNGMPILVRYTWRSLDRNHARWTQAFSTDHGRTWELNWIMNFARAGKVDHASSTPRPIGAAHR
jgi:hypothetical protein